MSEDRQSEIAAALAAVQARIGDACDRAGRTNDIDLLVVTKTFPVSDIEILASLGIREIGENRDQEATRKKAEVTADIRWHMLGQVQRNKAASVAGWADVVEAVDRPELVGSLARAAATAGRRLEVLIQVSLDGQMGSGRGGADPSDAVALAELVDRESALALRGVMAVAPRAGDPDSAFSLLSEVSESIRARWPDADRVSAGMSGDLEQAIAHGATQVRIGGAILGRRAAVQ